MIEPTWVEVDGVIRLNERVVAKTGEPYGLRSRELLESGCERARNVWFYDGQEDVAVLATTVLFGIARNHPFVQGNKRTAFHAMVGFLGANSFKLLVNDDVRLADDIISILNGEMDESEFSITLRKLLEFADQRPWR